jgi:hypothetical protein
VPASAVQAGDSPFTCGACPAGFSGDGETCDAVDDCNVGSHQESPCVNGACVDAHLGYACTCDAGWTLDTAATCDASTQEGLLACPQCTVDLDECAPPQPRPSASRRAHGTVTQSPITRHQPLAPVAIARVL